MLAKVYTQTDYSGKRKARRFRARFLGLGAKQYPNQTLGNFHG
jgi:hypothetical protein